MSHASDGAKELATAVARLDDDAYRTLVTRAAGATVDLLFDGVQIKRDELVANKSFGKGMRGAKKLALEERLRTALTLACPESLIATSLKPSTRFLIVRGGGDTSLDVGALGRRRKSELAHLSCNGTDPRLRRSAGRMEAVARDEAHSIGTDPRDRLARYEPELLETWPEAHPG